ncbi:2-amino-4-hydroxy-6-hydroxymethyldihydropteridine diphosphokinase [Halomonas sp. A11-A]|jgi:2-amino-4-hydroxy-6-hydroxymethyldihydropteridine diphosphokinase|uniref:2-amino-4-hydroxy-6- hydroxymethyldihydropteridine diphosphokinase n=1 Tax=Halomonas sp. A11-A TaxID=2183985 RepID=UPI000D70C793|nr:2-amino-4-hydroxy-6-hydroxymethyldihydropteridine diphosphokinase [Halomonas sp. A11-A]PWV73033.1 2-amino-4-hydroxy-6-hydroxymethyldihydropteridine diphosphokinase [Halomonas sp. A11-A]
MSPHRAWIGLGSNLDDPHRHVAQALAELDRLPLTRRLAASRLYASRPLGPQDQPDFINAVALLETRLSPLALLDQLQALEQRHRRVRTRRWGPRTLDLDLLLFDDSVLALPRLVVPHPELRQRAFVVMPLLELAPQLVLPNGERLAAAADALTAEGLAPLLPPT